MAKRECISSIVEVEHRVYLLETFIEVVTDAGGDEPPDWTMVARDLVKSLKTELQVLAAEIRRQSC